MARVPVTEKMTAEQFLALYQPIHGPRRRELIDGEVVVNEPGALHGDVLLNIAVELVNWTRAGDRRGHAAIPRDVKLDEHNVFQPDVLWYAHGRVPDPHSPPPYAVPDIAVEVRSPSTWRYNLGAKRDRYERDGLPELWLVDTVAQTVRVLRRSSPGAAAFDVTLELTDGDQLTSPLLPGFSLAVAEVFRLP